MKSVLISIQPKWVEKIANGEKTIEVRKTAPKCEVPFKCYIYCTSAKPYLYREANPPFKLFLDSDLYEGNGYDDRLFSGKVIGEFVCDWITEINPSCDINGCVNQYIHGYPAILGEDDCLSFNEMKAYLGNKKGYDWHISNLEIYDKPKELSEFFTPMGKRPSYMVERPPQSWCYVEE
jgi:predicted transcriptional regulator